MSVTVEDKTSNSVCYKTGFNFSKVFSCILLILVLAFTGVMCWKILTAAGKFLDLNYRFFILLAIFSLIFSVTVVCLTVLIFKDDENLRFSKLNEMNSLRKEFKNQYKDYKNYDVSDSESLKKKNLYADFVKSYMNALTEI